MKWSAGLGRKGNTFTDDPREDTRNFRKMIDGGGGWERAVRGSEGDSKIHHTDTRLPTRQSGQAKRL